MSAKVVSIAIPAPRFGIFDRFSVYYGEDCEKPTDLVLAVACRGIDAYLLDFERLIAQARTKEDALQLRHVLADYEARVSSLRSHAEDRMESFDIRGSAA